MPSGLFQLTPRIPSNVPSLLKIQSTDAWPATQPSPQALLETQLPSSQSRPSTKLVSIKSAFMIEPGKDFLAKSSKKRWLTTSSRKQLRPKSTKLKKIDLKSLMKLRREFTRTMLKEKLKISKLNSEISRNKIFYYILDGFRFI